MRDAPILRQVDVTWVEYRGRRLSYYGGSDYLRLSWHPAVRAAWSGAVEESGPGVGASRLTTGNAPVYRRLERALAEHFDVPGVSLTSSGYLAPMVAAQAVAADHTHVLLDGRCHACLTDAATLTALPVSSFPHRDPEGLVRSTKGLGANARVLVMTDGLFSHSGEVAPLAAYLAGLPRSATVLVDDAHGVGILGTRGRGTIEFLGIRDRRLIVTATLSKAIGSYGGMVMGPARLADRIRERSRIWVGNTPAPPPSAAGALAALAVLRSEGAERRRRLERHATVVRAAIRAAGFQVGDGPGPVFCLVPKSAADAGWLRRRLLAAAIYPAWIAYPNGPAERYFRFAISSEHTSAQLTGLCEVLADFGRRRA